MQIYHSLIAVALAAGLLAGCGGAPIPHAQAAQTQAAVRAAEEVGAADVPQGALHLQRARDEIAEAERLIAEDENVQADYVLRQAEADAELALALAKADDARREAEAAQERINQLKQRPSPAGGS